MEAAGNGTREDEVTHTLVGDRNFEIEPETATMREGDQEKIEIVGDPFNVFNQKEISADEYEWEITNVTEGIDGNIVDVKLEENTEIGVTGATFTAKHEGTANIKITDKVTGEEITLTRIVLAQDKDRISKITVNDILANLSEESTEDELIYKVQVVTNENTGILRIETNNKTDAISIDDGVTWSYNGDFNKTVDLPDKITEFTITVGIRNNEGEYPEETRITYKLYVEKISDNVEIKKLTATTKDENGNETEITAVPVSLTKYEVVISEFTDISRIYGLTNNEYSSISIDGAEYKKKEDTQNVSVNGELTKEIRILVKSEAGREAEYTLVLYEQNAALELIGLTVDGAQATKISEGAYAKKVSKDTKKVQIEGIVNSDIAYISINGNEYTKKKSTEEIDLTGEETEVLIRTKLDNGTYKEYTLTIQKETEEEIRDPAIEMVIVNGKLISPEKDGKTYIAYLPSIVIDAEIRGIAKESTTSVKIDENGANLGDSSVKVIVTDNEIENTHNIYLTGENGEENDYIVIIRKAGTDTSLSEVYAQDGDKVYTATKKNLDNYEIKVPGSISELDITGVTGYVKSKVQVADTGSYKVHIDTQKVILTGDETIVNIKVQSEDETVEKDYTLTIIKMSNNTKLLTIQVDGDEAVLGEDGIYRYTLNEAKTQVNVFAKTQEQEPNQTYVNIENSGYVLYETQKQIDIMSNETKVKIRVKAEDGSIEDYTLIIQGLPDDVNIKEVNVNNKKATYNFETSRYEVRCKEDEFDVEVILNDSLATLKLGTNETKQGKDNITIAKDTSNDETLLTVTVTSQSGLVTEKYTIAIMEQSKNSNLDTVIVNGNNVTQNADGIYYISLPHNTKDLDILATAEDMLATTKIADTPNSSYIANYKDTIVDGKVIYEYSITVTAENGHSAEYNLKIEMLEANYNILNVNVGENADNLNPAILQDDGNYYYKIKRVDKAIVMVELESDKSEAVIEGSSKMPVQVALPNDRTQIAIVVVGEDNTREIKYLIIEKESNDTSIKEITGEGILSVDIGEDTAVVKIDEDISSVDLDIVLNDKLGYLKLEDETEYEQSQIARTVTMTESSYILNLQIKAEDGTEKPYTVNLYKEANLNLKSVFVNSEEINYNKETGKYEVLVPNGNKPNVVITPENLLHKVQLINSSGTILGQTNGVLTVTPTLSTLSLEENFIIKVISHNGEDMGVKEYNLTIRQKSTDTEIIYIKVDGLGTNVNGTTYTSTVSGKDEYPVEIKLNDEKASVKITETNDEVLIDNQKGTLNGNLNIVAGTTKNFKVVVTAENGNEKIYTLTITRITSETGLSKIVVTDYDANKQIIYKNITDYDETTNTYTVQVSNELTSTEINITAISSEATITFNGISGKGTVSTNQTLPGLGITNVSIKVIAADGTQEIITLKIIQLPSEVGIEYLKVDEIELEQQTSTPNYNTEVMGKDEYPVEIRLTDEKANVRIEDKAGNVIINNQTGTLTGNLNIPDGETKEFVVVVTAQDGSIKNYSLKLNRISSKLDIEKITVTDIGDTIKEVTSYNADTKTYKVIIDKDITTTDIMIKAKSELATIKAEEKTSQNGQITFNKALDGIAGTTRTTTVPFEITAADGVTKETRYIQIVQLTSDIGLKEVWVDDILILPNGSGDYECETTDKVDLAKINAVTTDEASKVQINGQNERIHETEVNVNKGTARLLDIPIKVTAADGTDYIYSLKIKIISSNANVKEVLVDRETTSLIEGEYVAYIDRYETEANIEIKAEFEEAVVSYEEADGQILFGTGKLNFTYALSSEDEEYEIPFKITAEDKVTEKEYILKLIKKSDDRTIKTVYIDDILTEENKQNPNYPDGSYSAETIADSAKIKVIANSKFTKVEFAGSSGIGELEKYVALDLSKEITEIPVKITSQQGTTYDTTIYIKKVSNNCRLKTVKVDTKLAHISEDEANTYYAYVYDTANKARIQIEAENEYATVIRTDQERKYVVR